jgi:hypothetical protein
VLKNLKVENSVYATLLATGAEFEPKITPRIYRRKYCARSAQRVRSVEVEVLLDADRGVIFAVRLILDNNVL